MLIALGVVGVVKVADSILDARQRKIYKTPNQPVPECYRDVISPEKLESSRLYALDRSNFAKYSGIFGLVKELGFMLCFVTPLMLVWSDELLMKYCPRFLRRFLVGDLGKEIFLTNLFLRLGKVQELGDFGVDIHIFRPKIEFPEPLFPQSSAAFLTASFLYLLTFTTNL